MSPDELWARHRFDPRQTKEVKLRLPVAQVIRLHGLRLLRGQSITDTVRLALERYFDELERSSPRAAGHDASVAALD